MNNTKVATHTAQQGDVILKQLTSLPTGPRTPIAKHKLVLAEGETTGHYHGIQSKNSELFSIGNTIVMELQETATLTHQEHNHITLAPGLWEVGKVQEYDYLSKMKRPVMD
jgi:hypothetical protein